MLVLLIIFMVITPMLTKGAQVNLVKTRNPIKMQDADKEDAVLISITRDGKIWLSPGNSIMQLDQLVTRVKDLQAARTGDKTVYIRADARARYGSVEDVIDALRTDGVDQLGLITEEIQDKSKKGLSL